MPFVSRFRPRHSRIRRERLRLPKVPTIPMLSLGLVGFIFAAFVVAFSWHAIDSKLHGNFGRVVSIYDRYNKLVCVMSGNEEHLPVALKDVSPFMVKAVIAAEDHAFYQHHGVNPISILRALFVDVKSRRVLEGGSTITQQLAKNLYSKGAPRTLWQKYNETIIAWQLENNNSKEKILESYLNQIYFGKNAYGVERAAEEYFGKSASKLNLSESAFLAGLINSPSRLSAYQGRTDALKRQGLVLDNMAECKFISQSQAEIAKSTPLKFRNTSSAVSDYLYYIDAVSDQIAHNPDYQVDTNQSINVYTNLDPTAQHEAVIALNKGITHAPHGVNQGALVSISVPDSAVIALVGGTGNFWNHQFNRATSPHTVGSAFKPFVYLSGILSGTLAPHTVLYDEPITLVQQNSQPYSPRNFDHEFYGALTVRQALAKSRNVCAVEVANNTGVDKVIRVARAAGINAPLYPGLSLALGSCAVSPLEMASAYSTLARCGVAMQPTLIRKITDSHGRPLRESTPGATRVFNQEAVAELVDMMQDVVQYGTGTAARLPDRAVAGKTGTADQAKDVWFIGFTPDTVTAAWGGNDQQVPIPGTRVTGGSVMAGIWRDYMISYYKNHPTPVTTFAPPAYPFDRRPEGIIASFGEGVQKVEQAAEQIDNALEGKIQKHHGFFGFMKRLVGIFH